MDRGAWRATVHGVTRLGHDGDEHEASIATQLNASFPQIA